MKSFIGVLFCSCVMLFASVGIQASSINEPVPPKLVDVSVIDAPVVQSDVVLIPTDCFVMAITQPALTVVGSMAVQSKTVAVPGCPFRYLYKSMYCTHYSYTAYSRLITPY